VLATAIDPDGQPLSPIAQAERRQRNGARQENERSISFELRLPGGIQKGAAHLRT
jgi:hypothetical protein